MPVPDMMENTTIVAIATPSGRGGVGVVRISGPDAVGIAGHMVSLASYETRTALYRVLRDEDGNRLDDALITCFRGPHSYTGEDVVEIATHGSPVVLDWVVRRAVHLGAVPARPGEFTERAFLSGKLDLTAAEAVRDLIDAQTLHQARQAAEQMGGSIAAAVRPAKQSLVELIATLEAGIDFAEDDISTLPTDVIVSRIEDLLAPLRALLRSFAHGRVLREGLRLAIAGRPNAGKSSLFNRLLERERAIVTATAGTTRDVIGERISIGGVPVELLDTAGLRETADEAERIGVERTRVTLAEADAVLLVLDSAAEEDLFLAEMRELLAGRAVVVAQNKCDLLPHAHPRSGDDDPDGWLRVRTSALTGEGIPQLREALLQLAGSGVAGSGGATLTNLRQHGAVSDAMAASERASRAAEEAIPHEMLLLDLYEALRALDELTGQTTPDDVLSLIFSSFCIGK